MTDFAANLRRNCIWQRAKGTSRDNGYPYSKHLPDCDICQGADELEHLQNLLTSYMAHVMEHESVSFVDYMNYEFSLTKEQVLELRQYEIKARELLDGETNDG